MKTGSSPVLMKINDIYERYKIMNDKEKIINTMSSIILKYRMYGVKILEANFSDSFVIKIEVPEHSEVKLDGKEAAGSFLASSLKEDVVMAYSKIYPDNEIADKIIRSCVKVLYKTYPTTYTLQESVDTMNDKITDTSMASQYAKYLANNESTDDDK